MRIAYADPPYPGNGHRYPEKKEVNHRLLIAHLQEFDGWALSTAPVYLAQLLPLCPAKIRIGAWVKPWVNYHNAAPEYGWEAVLFKPARRWQHSAPTVIDWCSANPTKEVGIIGAKPEKFCVWIFGLLQAVPSDELFDLFPGSGVLTRAWDAWKRQVPLLTGAKQISCKRQGRRGHV